MSDKLDIRVDLGKATFGDLEMIMSYQDGNASLGELIPFLDRIVVGGVKGKPLTAMPAIMDALKQAFEELGSSPKNS